MERLAIQYSMGSRVQPHRGCEKIILQCLARKYQLHFCNKQYKVDTSAGMNEYYVVYYAYMDVRICGKGRPTFMNDYSGMLGFQRHQPAA